MPGLETPRDFNVSCPIPVSEYPQVLMAHGGGGRLMQQLIAKMFVPAFDNPELNRAHDGAVLDLGNSRIAFTTDAYVVQPLFFPGSDIGALAVNGTVNDLLMCGARPRWLSAAVILEEGLPMDTLWRVVQSMRQAANTADVTLVTGDTKVVDKGKGDGLFIATAGIGTVATASNVGPDTVQPGDRVLLSGDLGRHGVAILSVREGLSFDSAIESDCASLIAPVMALLENGIRVRCLRDLTRGGLASALNEIAASARLQIDIDEALVPVSEAVRGACELLGLDPLYVANEGRFLAIVAPADCDRALHLLRALPQTTQAMCIGTVEGDTPGLVTLRSPIGARRVLDLLTGEQLPRIC